jgi:putative DeoR family transcriptional regulator (stage III sporulation protein D)
MGRHCFTSVEEREDVVLEFARRIVATKATVREVAREVGYSKTLVHKTVVHDLEFINLQLHRKVREVLDYNIKQRHIRGGVSTKEKWAKIRGRFVPNIDEIIGEELPQ